MPVPVLPLVGTRPDVERNVGAGVLELAGQLLRRGPQDVLVADVVAYLGDVAGHPDTIGETFDLGGPDVLTYREMIERIGELRGRRPLIVEVPVLSPRLSSYWLHLVTPVRAGVARPIVEGLRNPTVAKETRIRELVPRDLLPFDAAARQALAA